MLDERLEIAIAVEQRIFAFNAACGDHGINRFANAHANRAQLAVIPGSRLALPTGFPDRPIGGISLRGIPSLNFQHIRTVGASKLCLSSPRHPIPRLSSMLLQHLHIRHHHPSVHRLAHVINGQQPHLHRGHGLRISY
jgi:hypothetical protein